MGPSQPEPLEAPGAAGQLPSPPEPGSRAPADAQKPLEGQSVWEEPAELRGLRRPSAGRGGSLGKAPRLVGVDSHGPLQAMVGYGPGVRWTPPGEPGSAQCVHRASPELHLPPVGACIPPGEPPTL